MKNKATNFKITGPMGTFDKHRVIKAIIREPFDNDLAQMVLFEIILTF